MGARARGGGEAQHVFVNTATTTISEAASTIPAQPGRPGTISIPIDRAE